MINVNKYVRVRLQGKYFFLYSTSYFLCAVDSACIKFKESAISDVLDNRDEAPSRISTWEIDIFHHYI